VGEGSSVVTQQLRSLGQKKQQQQRFFKRMKKTCIYFFFLGLLVGLFVFRVAPAGYGGSQARGLIRAVAASLCHSHSNARSKVYL